MKKLLSLVPGYVGRMGFYFLLVIVIFSVISAATGGSTVNLALVWSALVFGAVLSLADGVFALKFLGSYAVKLIVHTAIAIGAFALAFVAVSGVIEGGRSAVWSIFLFAILMCVISGIRAVIHAFAAKKENDQKSYDYLYTAKD